MPIDNSPLVSVVMPAYNGEKYIGRAIQSILKTNKDYPERIAWAHRLFGGESGKD